MCHSALGLPAHHPPPTHCSRYVALPLLSNGDSELLQDTDSGDTAAMCASESLSLQHPLTYLTCRYTLVHVHHACTHDDRET